MKKEEEKALAALHEQIPLMPHGQTLTSHHDWNGRIGYDLRITHKQEYAVNHNDYRLEITEIHDGLTAQQVLDFINHAASIDVPSNTTEVLTDIYQRTRKELKRRHKIAKEAAKTAKCTKHDCPEHSNGKLVKV